jgi:hypothetical protein
LVDLPPRIRDVALNWRERELAREEPWGSTNLSRQHARELLGL